MKDKNFGVIFLEKYVTKNEYYKTLKYKDNHKQSKIISNVKTLKENIKTTQIEDDTRRVFQFNKF